MEPAPLEVDDGKVDYRLAPTTPRSAPFLDGTADRRRPGRGRALDAPSTCACRRSCTAPSAPTTLRQLVAHFRAARLARRAVRLHLRRAARRHSSTRCARGAADDPSRRARGAAPRDRRASTRRSHGAVDIWCPTVNYVDDKPGNSSPPPRSAYDGQRLWWYQACMSHGCNIVGGAYFTGWPSYAVDAPAMSHRIMEWLTFRYRVGGELYYDTVEAYARARIRGRISCSSAATATAPSSTPGARRRHRRHERHPRREHPPAAHPRGARGLRVPDASTPRRRGKRGRRAGAYHRPQDV